MPRTILHIDMDAFYASIEQRDNPDLRGKPIIVGGRPDSRGVVSSASYEARAFGVRSAMPCGAAQRLCADGIFVPVDMEKYAAVSRALMHMLDRFTPTIEPVSIDEAFLDMSGTEGIFGSPEQMAAKVKETIRDELDLPSSVGVAPNKFMAKLASDAEKPDGLVVVREDEVSAFLHDLPIGRLWGVGDATESRLTKLGIQTIGQLADFPRALLADRLGQAGVQLHNLANGIDERPVEPHRDAKSLSSEVTFDEDISDRDQLEAVLFELSEQVAWRLRKHELRARTFTLKVRFSDFQTITRARTLPTPSCHGPEIYDVMEELLNAARQGPRLVRLLGVTAAQFVGEGDEVQLSLFGEPREQDHAVDKAMDAIAERFGRDAVVRARQLRPRTAEDKDVAG